MFIAKLTEAFVIPFEEPTGTTIFSWACTSGLISLQ
jgi:hypothetical protein